MRCRNNVNKDHNALHYFSSLQVTAQLPQRFNLVPFFPPGITTTHGPSATWVTPAAAAATAPQVTKTKERDVAKFPSWPSVSQFELWLSEVFQEIVAGSGRGHPALQWFQESQSVDPNVIALFKGQSLIGRPNACKLSVTLQSCKRKLSLPSIYK
jgi:hypothetical protein